MRIEGNDLRLAAATASQIQQTGIQQAVSPKPEQHQGVQSSSKEQTIQSLVGDKVSIKVELSKKTVDTLQKMGNISDFLNSAAISLRQTNDGLKATTNIVNEMKASLDNIIKSYPPYSLESKERIAQLMSYSSLKKQIVSLMVPAPPAPVYDRIQHLWEDLFSGPNNTIQTPTLPTNTPDSHIIVAASQLETTSRQIGLVQEALSNSVTAG